VWGLVAGLLSLIGVSLIRHEWLSEHLYLTLAVSAVACLIGTGSGFGVATYNQCPMSQSKRQADIALPLSPLSPAMGRDGASPHAHSTIR